jgi:hypothetical protein
LQHIRCNTFIKNNMTVAGMQILLLERALLRLAQHVLTSDTGQLVPLLLPLPLLLLLLLLLRLPPLRCCCYSHLQLDPSVAGDAEHGALLAHQCALKLLVVGVDDHPAAQHSTQHNTATLYSYSSTKPHMLWRLTPRAR